VTRGPATAATPAASAPRLLNAAWLTVAASIALTLIGVAAIDTAEKADAVGWASLAGKQGLIAILGVVAAGVVALPGYKLWTALGWVFFSACLALLVFLHLPFVPASIVTPRNGARGWIDLGPFDLQPAELTKIAYVLVVANYLRFRREHRELKGLIVPGLITAVPLALIMKQPDLGTASLFVPSLFGMLIAAGARLRHLTLIVVCAALAAPAAYPFLEPHQKQRIVALWAAIEGDRSTADDINFQSFTAQTLIGAGQVTGVGADAARALVRYNRLPEAHNDMVFAVVTARWGMLGAVGLIALYLIWIAGALVSSALCTEPSGRLLTVGLAAFIAAQMFINIGMNLGILPIIGITLPFVSYGGSSLITCWIMTGLVLNVALRRSRLPFRDPFEYPDRHGLPTGRVARGSKREAAAHAAGPQDAPRPQS
jgi:cell division protein FtsW (lipid II flippase)